MSIPSRPDFADLGPACHDDDVDAMFEQYLGGMDPEQIKMLIGREVDKTSQALDHMGNGESSDSDVGTASRQPKGKKVLVKKAKAKRSSSSSKPLNTTKPVSPSPAKAKNEKPTKISSLPTRQGTKVPTLVGATLQSKPMVPPPPELGMDNQEPEEEVPREPFRYESTIAHSMGARGKDRKGSSASSVFTFQKLVESVLAPDDQSGTAEQVTESLALAKFVDLSGCNVIESDDLLCLDAVTHLYLQHNALTELAGLSALMQLTILCVASNNITSLAPLAVLDHLIFLDASDNQILELDAGADLPSSLVDLRLEGNPCAPDYQLLQAYEEDDEEAADAAAMDEQVAYLDQYRSEILTFCPHLKFLDAYEVASFAPDHIIEAEDAATQPTMLADTLQNGIEGAELHDAEAEIDKAIRDDMEMDRDDDVNTTGEAAMNATSSKLSTSGNGSSNNGNGLSERQVQLMEAYLVHAQHGPTGASSLRPGTASRPSTASAVASVAALASKVPDESDESSSDEDTTDAIRRGTKVSGRVGGPAPQPEVTEDKGYAKLSERQREIAKELSIAQRHRDQLAKLQLMGAWDSATQSVHALRKASEERRRQLLFDVGGAPAPAVPAGPVKRLGGALAASRGTFELTSPSGSGEMVHSVAYTKAMEQLRKDVGGSVDLEKYRTGS